jgi:hypothetical protein
MTTILNDISIQRTSFVRSAQPGVKCGVDVSQRGDGGENVSHISDGRLLHGSHSVIRCLGVLVVYPRWPKQLLQHLPERSDSHFIIANIVKDSHEDILQYL